MNKVFKNFIDALGANWCNFESCTSGKGFWMYAVTQVVVFTIVCGMIEMLASAPSSGLFSTSRIIETL